MQAVSIIIPMFNAQDTIAMTLKSIFEQEYDAPVEVILIDDGSTDASLEIAQTFLSKDNFSIRKQKNLGAAFTTNAGIDAARHEIVCNVDADVVLCKNWLKTITEDFKDSRVAAVHGYYITPKEMPGIARLAGYDLEARYDAIRDTCVTHVSSGNTAYRKSALIEVGYFDAQFKYGYDNDMSYRLRKAGYVLIAKKNALCQHYWKPKFIDYLRQQFWSGYGRLQLMKKQKSHFLGDAVSGARMILHVPIMLLALSAFFIGIFRYFFFQEILLFQVASILILLLFAERIFFAVSITKKHKDPALFFLPFVHLFRDLAWCGAFLTWVATLYKKY